MSDRLFRLSWENARNLRKYSNADPTLYKNTTQIVPNSEIPDEDWSSVSKLDTNPWAQFNQLKAHAEADEGFVRNVTLDEVAVTETVIRRHYPAEADEPHTIIVPPGHAAYIYPIPDAVINAEATQGD